MSRRTLWRSPLLPAPRTLVIGWFVACAVQGACIIAAALWASTEDVPRVSVAAQLPSGYWWEVAESRTLARVTTWSAVWHLDLTDVATHRTLPELYAIGGELAPPSDDELRRRASLDTLCLWTRRRIELGWPVPCAYFELDENPDDFQFQLAGPGLALRRTEDERDDIGPDAAGWCIPTRVHWAQAALCNAALCLGIDGPIALAVLLRCASRRRRRACLRCGYVLGPTGAGCAECGSGRDA